MKIQRKIGQDMKNRKKLNSDRAITLVALVVTIVVLLILAGVSIQMLAGDDGIIRQAKNAKDKTNEANAKERIEVEVIGSYGATGGLEIDLLNKNLKTIDRLKYKGAYFSDTNKITSLPATVELDGVKVVINGDGSAETISPIEKGKTYLKDTTVTIGDDTVAIPGGTTVSGITGEYEKIEDGIVIYIMKDADGDGIIDTPDWSNPTMMQETYDQFVWVPVKNAVLDLSSNSTALSSEENIKSALQAEINAGRYPMAIKKDATNYFGVLYQFSLNSETNTVKVEPYSSWTPLCESSTNYREPSAVTSYDKSSYLLQVNGILNTSYSDSTSFGNALQTEFNTMVNKVSSNGGFWVGRYETSGMSNTTTTTYASSNEVKVNVVKGATNSSDNTSNISKVTWYRMYAQQKIYSKLALGSSTTATSSMIWGSQWDQIMIWMKEVKNTNKNSYYVINSLTMGNFGTSDDSYSDTSNPAATGCFDVKNIYDLAGNVNDWTLAANGTYNRVGRGGYYCGTDTSITRADLWFSSYTSSGYTSYGSRSTLY